MRIVHISDLHLSSMPHKKNNYTKTKKIIEQAMENGAQHFVFTGDISDNADEKDFKLLRNLLSKHGLLCSEKASIVIGNHDIFGGPQTVHEVVGFPSKCLKVNYNQKVSMFVNHFKELFDNTIRLHEEFFFPYIKIFKNVLLIGLNSIDYYSRLKNLFASNGHVSKQQRKFLKYSLAKEEFEGKTKIVLVHHHFYPKNIASHSSEFTFWNRIENFTLKLRGKKKLLKTFNESDIKLVLHGHSHEIKEYKRDNIHFVNAGATIDNDSNDSSAIIIDVSPVDISTSLLEIKSSHLSINKIQTLQQLPIPVAVS